MMSTLSLSLSPPVSISYNLTYALLHTPHTPPHTTPTKHGTHTQRLIVNGSHSVFLKPLWLEQ